MSKQPGSFISLKAARRALLTIAIEAQEADPRLVVFIERLWRHCAERPRCYHLDKLTLPSTEMREFGDGADTKIDGRRRGYRFFRDRLPPDRARHAGEVSPPALPHLTGPIRRRRRGWQRRPPRCQGA